jgi:hypothetical protein
MRSILKQAAPNVGGLGGRAIAEYHELLAADEALIPAMFEKLRDGLRKTGCSTPTDPLVQRDRVELATDVR